MAGNQALNVNLPDDVLQMVRDKVASGEYDTESDVVEYGLRVLQERDAELDVWLRTEVVPTYKAYLADPTKVIPIDQVFDGLTEGYLARKARREG